MWVLKVKVISLPYIFQVLFVLCFTWPRYQVSVYRTIGPLVFNLQTGGRTGLVARASNSGSGDPGSILGRAGVLFLWARDIYSPKVLVIPRNRWLRLNMTEKLFTGTLNHNKNKKTKKNKICRRNFVICFFGALWVNIPSASFGSTLYSKPNLFKFYGVYSIIFRVSKNLGLSICHNGTVQEMRSGNCHCLSVCLLLYPHWW